MSTNDRDIVHPEDADLVRYLDRELAPVAQQGVKKHVSVCAGCAERLGELDEASQWLREHRAWMDRGIEIDEVARARALSEIRRRSSARPGARVATGGGGGRRFLRAAAAVAVLVAAGFSVQPLSAWIVERVWRGSEAREALVVSREPAVAAEEVGSIVSFRPGGPLFRIEFAHPQTRGSLTLEGGDDAQASAQIMSPGDETMLILPAGLRVDNSAASVTDYRIRLPQGLVRQVEVYAGGQRIVARDLATFGAAVVVGLDAP